MNDKLQADRMQRVEKRERHVSEWKANAPVALELSLARPTRFDVDDPRLLAHLDEHGYAVVAAVATPSNLTEASDLLWEWLGDAASWTRGSPETWTDSSFRAIGDPSRGLVRTSSAIPPPRASFLPAQMYLHIFSLMKTGFYSQNGRMARP